MSTDPAYNCDACKDGTHRRTTALRYPSGLCWCCGRKWELRPVSRAGGVHRDRVSYTSLESDYNRRWRHQAGQGFTDVDSTAEY